MNGTKPWYMSKIVWAGVITTLIGALEVVQEWVAAGSFQAEDIVVLVVGILTVVFRVWFTDKPIE